MYKNNKSQSATSYIEQIVQLNTDAHTYVIGQTKTQQFAFPRTISNSGKKMFKRSATQISLHILLDKINRACNFLQLSTKKTC